MVKILRAGFCVHTYNLENLLSSVKKENLKIISTTFPISPCSLNARKNRWKKYLLQKTFPSIVSTISSPAQKINLSDTFDVSTKISNPPLPPSYVFFVTPLIAPFLIESLMATREREVAPPEFFDLATPSCPSPTLAVGAAFCLGDHAQRPSATTKVFHGELSLSLSLRH